MPENSSSAIPLGLCGEPLPTDPAQVDAGVAALVAELGFSAVTLHLGAGLGLRPADVDPKACERIRETFAAHGLAVMQSWAFGPSFVVAAADRPPELERLDGAMRVAADLGAEAVIGGCGSMGNAGRYAPHPENHAPATRARLVEALKAAGELGERRGVALALEPHVLTTLDTPERVRELVDASGSPFVRVNLDPANLVDGLETAYDSAAHMARCVEILGPVAVSGHVKDVVVGDDFVLHLSEAAPGDGVLDLHAFVRRFAAQLPGRTLSIEHLAAAEVPRAKAALDRIVAEALA